MSPAQLKVIACVHRSIAKEVKYSAVKGICAGSGDDVDDRTGMKTILRR